MSPDFSVTAVETDDAVTITAHGELDLATCRDLDTLLRAAVQDHRDVIVDLADICFADSTALVVLIRAHTALADQGRRLVLAAPTERITRLLALSGLSTVLHIEPRADRA
jgi:anti-sigma B factor antagonist